jgi:cbb3-type cytochrome oxidase subunit 3
VSVLVVFFVMLALFGGLIWMAFRTARRGRREWTDDDE